VNTLTSLYASAALLQTTRGLPEGYAAWGSTTYTLSEAERMLGHVWGAGAVSRSQRIYDQGLPDGFDWRTLVPGGVLEAATTAQAYDDLRDDYRVKLQSTGRIGGLRYMLEQMRLQYGYLYDHNNSSSLSDTAYQAYLESQRVPGLDWVYDSGAEGSYRDLYDTAGVFGFTYAGGLDAAGLAALKSSFFTAVVSWSAIAAYQENYDLGQDTPFWTLSGYPAIRNPAITSRLVYFSSLKKSCPRAIED